MLDFLKQKIFLPLIDLLMQGISPEKLALSIALGFIVGIVPMIGVTTIICAILAIWLKLNIVAIQIVNYIAAPLQLILYIPFIKAGEKILGITVSDFQISEIIKLFHEGFIRALKILWVANLQGIFAWVIISIPLSLFLYFLFRTVFRRFAPAEVSGD